MKLIVFALKAKGQSVSVRTPSKYGITHHTIKKNKIQIMKDINLAMESIKRYKRSRNIGYIMVGCGLDVFYYTCAPWRYGVSVPAMIPANIRSKKNGK